MTSLINLSIRLCLNLLLFTTFLLISSYQSNAQEKTVSFKDLVESTDSLNSPIYLYKGSPYSDFVSNYYENGNLDSHGNYLNGKKVGVWKYYDESGKLIKSEKFD